MAEPLARTMVLQLALTMAVQKEDLKAESWACQSAGHWAERSVLHSELRRAEKTAARLVPMTALQ